MVTLPVWPWFGKVEALSRKNGRGTFERKNVAFECGTQKRMETETDTRKTGLSGLFCLSLFSLKTTLLKAKSGLGL